MRTFLFPGQGAQFVGMGEELFEEYSALVKEADKILGYSLKDLCLKDDNSLLNNTASRISCTSVILLYLPVSKSFSLTPSTISSFLGVGVCVAATFFASAAIEILKISSLHPFMPRADTPGNNRLYASHRASDLVQ